MGLCSSEPQDPARRREKEKNDRFNKALSREQKEDQRTSKLLLLGAGDSGKSTVLKQIMIIYGLGWSPEERLRLRDTVRHNLVNSGMILAVQSEELPKRFPELKEQVTFAPESAAAVQYFKDVVQASSKGGVPLQVLQKLKNFSEEAVQNLETMWADPASQALWLHRALYQINDNTQYLMENIQKLAAADYLPDDADIIIARTPTTGIVTKEFLIDDQKFQVTDVGGQRNERKKWIQAFDNVTAVLFLASLSGYNQKLFEDDTQNRMVESMALFADTLNNPVFAETPFILFLNKRDLFEEKLKTDPLSKYFPGYKGDNSYDNAKEWIHQQFVNTQDKENNEAHTIFIHFTHATNRENAEFVLAAVKDIVVRRTMYDAGLLFD